MDAKAKLQLAMTFDSERGVLTITEYEGRSYFFPPAEIMRNAWMECGGSLQFAPVPHVPQEPATSSTPKLEIEVAKDTPEVVFARFTKMMEDLCRYN